MPSYQSHEHTSGCKRKVKANHNTAVETGRNGKNATVDKRRTSILTGTVTEIANEAKRRTPRTRKLHTKTEPTNATLAVMNTLQAHGTTTHELTQNTAGQSQPQDSHGHITAANSMEHTNSKQTLVHSQDIGQCLQRTPLARLPPGHNSVHSQNISQTLHNTPNASRWPKH